MGMFDFIDIIFVDLSGYTVAEPENVEGDEK